LEFNQAVVTTKGQALMAKLLAGSATTKFTKVATSSTVYQQSQLEGLTALTNVKQTVVPTSYENNASTVKVVAAINNEGLTAGYYINTVGLYATDSDGSEILYSVAIATVNGYMPPDTGVSKSGIELKIYTAVSNASNVDLTVDPSAVATISDIAQVNENLSNVYPGGANILRNTNTDIRFANSGTWSNGAWVKSSAKNIESIALTDAPNPDIVFGVRIDDESDISTCPFWQFVPLVIGIEYTLSCYVRCGSGEAAAYLQYGADGGWKRKNFSNIPDYWTRLQYTFIPTVSGGTTFGLTESTIAVAEFCGMKLEVGNKATGWCPSPWDMVSRVDYNALADRVAVLEAK